MEQAKEKVSMDLIYLLSTMLICRSMKQSVRLERDFPTRFCKQLMTSSKIRYHNSSQINTELQMVVKCLMCGSTLAQCGRLRAQIFRYIFQ
jgi:RNase P subunit RPR2